MPQRRALIVNCYSDESRLPVARPWKLPQAMAPAFLAGAFAPGSCEIRLHSELAGGPLEDEAWLGWPDLLVLTGLNTAFDRMKQLTAYARTRNPRVVVAAGGPAVRSLPKLSGRYFDYVCTGDVEQLRDVVRDAWGTDCVADEMSPRFDLLPPGRIGYAETSRNCQFRCSFCTLTAHRNRYRSYPPDEVRRQVVSQGRKDLLVLLDNNFYGPDRADFRARLETLAALYREGRMGGWAALVTADFFTPENLRAARAAGCLALFSGVESFDAEWLRSCRKQHNTRIPQLELIGNCLDAGILFSYGLMLDVTSRTLADLERELEFIFSTPEIPLPAYFSLPIPILGTPFFHECVRAEKLLPSVKLRDMDSTTLTLRPLDPLPEAAAFVRKLQTLSGRRAGALAHTLRFAFRRFGDLNAAQRLMALGTATALCAPRLCSGAFVWPTRNRRTYVATTEPLEHSYTPAFPVAARYEGHFAPTMVTDAAGRLSAEMAELAVARAEAAGLRPAREEPARVAEVRLDMAAQTAT